MDKSGRGLVIRVTSSNVNADIAEDCKCLTSEQKAKYAVAVVRYMTVHIWFFKHVRQFSLFIVNRRVPA